MTVSRILQTSLHSAARGLAGLIWPRVCPACEAVETESPLCDACSIALLHLVAASYCSRCGTSLGPHIPEDDGCWQCPPVSPRFRQVVRLGAYAAPLRRLIWQFKFHRDLGVLGELSRMLAKRIEHEVVQQIDVILAMPMHWRRRLQRTGNSAERLADELSRDLNVPVGDELIRVRNTPPQASLSRTARADNVRDAFDIRGGRHLKGRHVLLVDDVTTTGATANEATRVLIRSGADRVTLAVLSKTERLTGAAASDPEKTCQ